MDHEEIVNSFVTCAFCNILEDGSSFRLCEGNHFLCSLCQEICPSWCPVCHHQGVVVPQQEDFPTGLLPNPINTGATNDMGNEQNYNANYANPGAIIKSRPKASPTSKFSESLFLGVWDAMIRSFIPSSKGKKKEENASLAHGVGNVMFRVARKMGRPIMQIIQSYFNPWNTPYYNLYAYRPTNNRPLAYISLGMFMMILSLQYLKHKNRST